MLSIIVAIARNGIIGSGNSLIWHISEDLRRFKAITSGHPVVMGRKTFESIGRALPGRTNVVITRQSSFLAEGCTVVHSLEEALALFPESEEVFVIGGGEIYAQALAIPVSPTGTGRNGSSRSRNTIRTARSFHPLLRS